MVNAEYKRALILEAGCHGQVQIWQYFSCTFLRVRFSSNSRLNGKRKIGGTEHEHGVSSSSYAGGNEAAVRITLGSEGVSRQLPARVRHNWRAPGGHLANDLAGRWRRKNHFWGVASRGPAVGQPGTSRRSDRWVGIWRALAGSWPGSRPACEMARRDPVAAVLLFEWPDFH